jgi:hypothetical protein
MAAWLGLPGVDFLLFEAVSMTGLSIACFFGWVD